ncbi:MAG: PHP domain-containing protein [Spirochaetota bacterium]
MNKKIDLHIHSNFSEDADLSIEELFKQAMESSVSVIAITDHDSVKSIDIASNTSKRYQIEYIPGIEITTVFPVDNSQQHILGYYINNKDSELLRCLDKIAELRKKIARQRIEALRKLNFSLNEDNIWALTGDRPPTAVSIMTEIFSNKNNLNDKRLYDYLHGEKKDNKMGQFYKDYFTENGQAYVPFESVSTREGIEIIKKAGGVPIIAHPVFLKEKRYLDIILEMGIAGMEAISTYHKQEDVIFYSDYAVKNNLLITAGSDYHGPTAKPHIKLGKQDGMDYSYYEKLKDFHNMK